MLYTFLRVHNLDSPNLFAKHQTVLHASQLKIINFVSKLIEMIGKNLFDLLIFIKPAF